MKKLLAIVLILTCCNGFAQSSDVLHYYVLYDVSASVKRIDRNNNLKELLKELLNSDGGQLQPDVYLTLYTFGNGTDKIIKHNFQANPDFKLVEKQISGLRPSASEMHTDLLQGLRAVKMDIDSTSGGAMFIFSDGRLLPGDFPGNDSVGYYKSVKGMLDSIGKIIPAFYIQSSPEPGNNFIKAATENKSFAGKNYFWINSHEKTTETVKQEFNQFAGKADDQSLYFTKTVITNRQDTSIFNKLLRLGLSSKEKGGFKINTLYPEGSIQQYKDEYISRETVRGLAKAIKEEKRMFDQSLDDKKADIIRFAAVTKSNTSVEAIEKTEKELQGSLEHEVIQGIAQFLIKRSEQELVFHFLEQINEKVFSVNPMLSDTLFNHTAFMIRNYNNEDLVQLKLAIVKDLEELPANLMKTKFRPDSDGLAVLTLFSGLMVNLSREKNLESAITRTFKVIEADWAKRDKQSISKVEVSFQILSGIMDMAKEADIVSVFKEMSEEERINVATLMAVELMSRLDTYSQVNVKMLSENIIQVIEQYGILRERLIESDSLFIPYKEFGKSLAEWHDYNREIRVMLVKSISDLLVSATDAVDAIRISGSGELAVDPLRAGRLIRNITGGYIHLENKEYQEAAVAWLPYITELFVKFTPARSSTAVYSFDRDKVEEAAAALRNEALLSTLKSEHHSFFQAISGDNYDLKEASEDITLLIKNKGKSKGRFWIERKLDVPFYLIKPYFNREKVLFRTKWELKEPYAKMLDTVNYAIKITRAKLVQGELNQSQKDTLKMLASPQSKKQIKSLNLPFSVLVNFLVEDTNNNYTLRKEFIAAFQKKDTILEIYRYMEDLLETGHRIRSLNNWEKNAIPLEVLNPYLVNVKYHHYVERFLAMLPTITELRTSEDVQALLAATTLPVASYRIKRSELNSITVNSYVGMGVVKYDIGKGNYSIAMNAPIGLEYTRSLNSKNHSLSAMLGVLDVGNVIHYSLNGGSEEESFELSRAFSPGLYFAYGFSKKLPLSISIGAVTNPWRYCAFISLDIPLFKLN